MNTCETCSVSGLLVPAGCLIAVGFSGCNYVLVVVLLCIAGTFDGISQSGFNVNHLDIAPKYAGRLTHIKALGIVLRVENSELSSLSVSFRNSYGSYQLCSHDSRIPRAVSSRLAHQ